MSPAAARAVVEAVGRQQQHLGVRVLEVEAELVFLVRGIQRRGGSGHRRGEERHDVRQAVRQRHADAVAAVHAGGRQRFRHGLDLRAQFAVRDSNVLLRRDDRRPVGGNRLDQTEQRLRSDRCAVRGCHRCSPGPSSWPTGRCRNGDSHVSPDANATANSQLRLGFTSPRTAVPLERVYRHRLPGRRRHPSLQRRGERHQRE